MPEADNTIIAGLRKYIKLCPHLKNLDIYIEQTEAEPVNYSISSAGMQLIKRSITGVETWQYNAVLQSREYTADDLARLNNSGFTENLIFWLSDQNSKSNFPVLPSSCTATQIYADNGLLMAMDENGDRGIYQIQIHLNFKRGGNY